MFTHNHTPQSNSFPHGWKVIAAVFSFGVTLGTGLGYGFQAATVSDLPLPTLFLPVLESPQVGVSFYDKLDDGITLTEARTLLGPGIEQSRSPSTIVVAWRTPDGTGVQGTFTAGRLESKERLTTNR